ncbi:hypothetical protein ACSSS7_007312 [Eimeria intestinalis]
MEVVALAQEGEGSQAQIPRDKEEAQGGESASSFPVAECPPNTPTTCERGPLRGPLSQPLSRQEGTPRLRSASDRTQDESTHASASSLPLSGGVVVGAAKSSGGTPLPLPLGSTLGPGNPRGGPPRRSTPTGCPPDFEENFRTTIQHMDHRRLQRQLNGVRKKDPHMRVMFMTLFCLLLLAWNSAYLDTSTECWKVGFVVKFAGLRGAPAIGAGV